LAIGDVPITTVAVPITPSGRGAIGGISFVIGRTPIGLSAYLCRFRLFWEADRHDRRVRGLSSFFRAGGDVTSEGPEERG
jgi:hypothetical protein